jgi:hypothetical protein
MIIIMRDFNYSTGQFIEAESPEAAANEWADKLRPQFPNLTVNVPWWGAGTVYQVRLGHWLSTIQFEPYLG